jgi:hypothetical protein
MRIVAEPLPTPSLVRPSHEPQVLYVRVAAPTGPGTLAVLPDARDAVLRAVAASRADGHRVQRAVVVGADAFLDPAVEEAEGRALAEQTLVDVIEALVAESVPFVWRTRGGIGDALPTKLAQALADARTFAVVEVGVPSLEPELCAAFEGHTGAAPQERLRLAGALTARGVNVRGLVDPLVPMLSDTQQHLEELVSAFADAGVARIGARYMLLTPDRARAVASRLAGMQRALIQGVFLDEPWQKPDPAHGSGEVHKRIPGHLRRSGHHRLIEAGARHGVVVDVLDPVTEGEDLTSHIPQSADADAEKPKRPAKVRKRPQLELFRKSR